VAVTTAGLADRKVVLLGATDAAKKWLTARKIPVAGSMERDSVVIVWNLPSVTRAQRADARAIRRFAAGGGRVVVLRQAKWDWPELIDVEMLSLLGSRAFPYSKATHPVLKNVDPLFLRRFNGAPGGVADRSISGDLVKDAKRLLWVERPACPVMVSFPVGKGEILVTTMTLKTRLRGAAHHDPVAERLLLNMIGR